MGGSNVTGVEVDALHATGGKIKGRSDGSQSAAHGLKNGLDSASGSVGQGRIKGAVSSFVTNHVVDDSNLLSHQVSNAGSNVSFVASTTRAEDEEGGRSVQQSVSDDTTIANRINHAV